MSASTNADSITADQGEFRSRVPRAKPMTTKGHAPGVMVGNDAIPEFHAETLEPGTAPAEYTHQPNPQAAAPGQEDNDATESSTRTSADDSLPGATSGSVHDKTEFGKPVQGHSGGKAKKERSGLAGDAAGGTGPKGKRGASDASEMKGVTATPAEDRVPVGAEELAAELERK